MTTGERIAQKRRELGLSQEALGERMGVSRQTIYKWESDAALPEIEKLVNLSREFGVSVGWLLGEEDEPEKQELTPEQLAMVEEIVGRYLEARKGERPESAPPQKHRLRTAAAVLLLLGALASAASLFSRLDQVTNDYNRLQNSVNNISSDVGHRIDSIASRVEEVLQRQNDLTAEQSAQVVSTDYRANTVTIAARALPRTFVEGMTAEFILESGGERFTVPGTLGSDHAFTAEAVVPLSDDIPVSVVLISGDQRQTQLLDEFFALYAASFPSIDIFPDNLTGRGDTIRESDILEIAPEDAARIQSLRLGLFRDKKLVAWYRQLEEKPENYRGENWENTLFFRLEGEHRLEPGHVYQQAAVIVDEYGRERVYASLPAEYDPERDIVTYVDGGGYYVGGMDPEGWEYS